MQRAASPAVYAPDLRYLLSLSRDFPALNELASTLPPLPYQGLSLLTNVSTLPGIQLLHNAAHPGLDVVFESVAAEGGDLSGLRRLQSALNDARPIIKKPAVPSPPSSRPTSKPLRLASRGTLPPVQPTRRISELYSPLEWVAHQTNFTDFDTPEGRKLFKENLQKRHSSGIAAPIEKKTMSTAAPCVVIGRSVRQGRTVLQAMGAREERLRNEIAHIQSRSTERQVERRVRQDRKRAAAKGVSALPPLRPMRMQRTQGGRGKLLNEICKRYGTLQPLMS
ncbi:hypothetical protein DIPPA_15565 [Diplonema papillatum]|nr:hypothetical protein DIPPA_15565 [Diplonema papillatum]